MLEQLAAAAGEMQAHTEVAGTDEHAGGHAEATVFGFAGPGFFVALAMLVVFAIMLKARVPALIAKVLDDKIAGIREQLDTAANLRNEAEALKLSYERKAKEADKEIAALREGAERQATEIVAKAKQDATDLIARHKSLAEAKIAAAERTAIAELRARAADASTAAAASLIAQKHDAAADSRLADELIAKL